MRRHKCGEIGSFDTDNIHNGVCWGWPKECSLTNLQARTIFFTIYQKKVLTLHQLIVVRKSLSYSWELTGHLPGGNYPGVKEVWSVVREHVMADKKHVVLPARIPTPDDLHTAFNKEWTTSCPMTLINLKI